MYAELSEKCGYPALGKAMQPSFILLTSLNVGPLFSHKHYLLDLLCPQVASGEEGRSCKFP